MTRALPLLVLLAGCDVENILALGRERDVCEANLPPACGSAPRCVLEPTEFLQGQFPGARRFVVRTEGAAKVTFQLLIERARASGTELLLRLQEPNCSDLYTYDSAGRDIIRLANTEGIIKMPLSVLRAGDHPVEMTSDAYFDFTLIVDVENVVTDQD